MFNENKFEIFFKATHNGNSPFPWQVRMARKVFKTGQWPRCLKAPTASGKTSLMDIAVFWLAYSDDAPRRIVDIIDRRIVVSDKFVHAMDICNVLKTSKDTVIKEMAANLRRKGGLTDSDDPIKVFQLRGGIPQNNKWAENPVRPVILISTVDQVGSRMLDRGYGCSRKTRSLHAGLLANDVIIFLDEAQCSFEFMKTVLFVEKYRKIAERPNTTPFHFVIMSATPPLGIGDVFELDEADWNHPVLGKRLKAKKPTKLVRYNTTLKKYHKPLAKKMVDEAIIYEKQGHKLIVIFVDEVPTGKHAEKTLKQKGKCVFLLTGRMREAERKKLLAKWQKYLTAGTNEEYPETIYVVCTQCLEVGANLDFQALVTECADIDSLRQRFGRLNRLGILDKCAATIVICGRFLEQEHPIYGDAMANTWRWLGEHEEGLDMGVVSLDQLLAEVPDEVLRTLLRKESPHTYLLPAHLDLLVQTTNPPNIDVAPFLHGLEFSPDIQVVWRADLNQTTALDSVIACPPRPSELMNVPLPVFRRWAAAVSKGQEDVDYEGYSDFVGEQDKNKNDFVVNGKGFYCVRWLGKDESVVVTDITDIRPGDLLVLPVPEPKYYLSDSFPGQLNEDHTLNDIGNDNNESWLRIHPNLLQHLQKWQIDDLMNATEEEIIDLVIEAFPDVPEGIKNATIQPHPDQGWILYFPKNNSKKAKQTKETLVNHNSAVGEKAKFFASLSKHASDYMDDIGLAGGVHDVGKADHRFQILLNHGNPPAELLAKSEDKRMSKRKYEEIRAISGFPTGGRHEITSIRMLESSEIVSQAKDIDLVLHLAGAHHGHCRPLAYGDPAVDSLNCSGCDASNTKYAITPETQNMDDLGSGVADRFWRLIRRYGWWGLSWLESFVILADHRCSEQPKYGEDYDE